MSKEHELIPFAGAELPAGPWLVFAASPDDETFGMGGTMLLARRADIPVEIVFVTDGDDSSSAEVARAREEEAISVCREIGVRRSYFWRQPGRGLRYQADLVARIVHLIDSIDPGAVYIPSCVEIHPDPRTTARLVWEAAKSARNFTGKVISYDILSQGPANRLVDVSRVWDQKKDLMRMYASRLGADRYMKVVEGLDRARSLTMPESCRAAEGFHLQDSVLNLSYEEASLAWFNNYIKVPEWYDAPLVSVIVRTKDRRVLLREALSSLLTQDYPGIELIVVNDGGCDVQDIVNDFGCYVSGYKYLKSQDTEGRPAAANKGLEAVSGDFFIFLDDDDWLDPPHISNLIRALKNDPNALVAYAGVRTVSSDDAGKTIFNSVFDRNRMYYENFIPIHAALVSRSVIDAGHRFDQALEAFSDWDFWLQVLQRTREFVHVDTVSANYRITSERGVGVKGGYDDARRLIYSRWAKTWGVDEIDDLLTRLSRLSRKHQA